MTEEAVPDRRPTTTVTYTPSVVVVIETKDERFSTALQAFVSNNLKPLHSKIYTHGRYLHYTLTPADAERLTHWQEDEAPGINGTTTHKQAEVLWERQPRLPFHDQQPDRFWFRSDRGQFHCVICQKFTEGGPTMVTFDDGWGPEVIDTPGLQGWYARVTQPSTDGLSYGPPKETPDE